MPSLESSVEDKHVVGMGVKEPGGEPNWSE